MQRAIANCTAHSHCFWYKHKSIFFLPVKYLKIIWTWKIAGQFQQAAYSIVSRMSIFFVYVSVYLPNIANHGVIFGLGRKYITYKSSMVRRSKVLVFWLTWTGETSEETLFFPTILPDSCDEHIPVDWCRCRMQHMQHICGTNSKQKSKHRLKCR